MKNPDHTNPSISVIIPCFNDDLNVKPLFDRLLDVFGDRKDIEFILIDDGSPDGTFERLRELNQLDKRFRVIKFTRNFGQRAALNAGLKHAGGEFIITMDSDLQNDPGDIEKLVAELRKGAEIVCGWRVQRYDAFIKRKLPSFLVNKVLSLLSGVWLHDFGCALNGFRREIALTALAISPSGFFLKSIACLLAKDIREVAVSHSPRMRGESAYNFRKLHSYFQFLISNLIETRLKLWGASWAGIPAVVLILVLGAYVLGHTISNGLRSGYDLILIFLILILEIQFAFLLKGMLNSKARKKNSIPSYEIEVVLSGE